MNLQTLQIHISTREHKRIKAECVNESETFDQNIPADPPRCDICNRYFSNEEDMKCHMTTRLHHIRLYQSMAVPDKEIPAFTDNNDLEEKLASLPQPPPKISSILRSRLENQPGRIAGTFESGQFVVIQFVHSDVTLHALFDKTRVANKDKSTFPMVGFPVTFNAARIEPELPGVSSYIQYWASSVIMGDGVKTDSLAGELTYNQLRREIGPLINIGLEDAKAEIKYQVDTKLYGAQTPGGSGYTVLLDEYPEHVAGESGIVMARNSSSVLIRIDSSGMNALLILEDCPLTEIPRDSVEEGLDLEPGTKVSLNGVLMDVTKQAQYLCTSVWRQKAMTSIKRDRLMQACIEMYHALVLALPPPQALLGDIVVPSFSTMEDVDMTGLIDINALLASGGLVMPGGLAEDDLAADDGDDLAASDDISEEAGEKPKKSFGIKIASFAN